MSDSKISVILADDHAVVRAGFRRLLEEEGDIEVVAEADSGAECLDEYERCHPDVVVMDIAMPEMDGLQALHRFHNRFEDPKVLILSYHEEAVFAERALAEGAAGYLSKSAAPELLPKAIRQIAEGGRFLDPDIAQEMALRGSRGGDNPLEGLSEREFAVFLQLAEGLSANEIAVRLHISPNTVNTHLYRIKRKLGVTSRTELTRLAIRHNLIEA
ncbi:response regulator [Endothiovibrio diazotrophicus]